jgi:hypothetical protein
VVASAQIFQHLLFIAGMIDRNGATMQF